MLKKLLFIILILTFIADSVIAQSDSLKVCIKNSDGKIVLKKKCGGKFTSATLSSINQANSDLISALQNSNSSLEANDQVLADSIEGRFDSIPSGKSVYGYVGMDTEISNIGGDYRAFFSLPVPPNHIVNDEDVLIANIFPSTTCEGVNCLSTDETSFNSVCTGTIDNPTAPAGKVCIYISSLSDSTIEAESVIAIPFENGRGLAIGARPAATGDFYLRGSWAYTAP